MAGFREGLIRQHFEAMRDLTWAQELEPKFRQRGVSGEAMEELRAAWNVHAERRDWAWWQNHAKGLSNALLQRELQECIEELGAIGPLQSRREKHATEREAFQQVVKGTAREEEPAQEAAKSRDGGREM